MSTWFETSPSGLELIKRFEGCAKRRPDGLIEAYKVGDDLPTIGWGLTGAMPDGRPVVLGLTITQQEADDALEWFVKNVSDPLTRKHFNARTQNEFDALSSWVYNLNHNTLERGGYSLPSLVNLKDRNLESIISKWVEYRNPKTIFEQGLYRRRLAEVCMFLGLPWHFALNAVLKRAGGVIVDITLPDYVISQAERLAEMQAKERASREPPPPKAKTTEELNTAELEKVKAKAPKPKPEPAPKPPSPKTVQPAEVPYRIDPNAGLKPLEESDRAKGFVWQQISILILRVTSLGTFGTGAAGVANVVQSDAALSGAILNLTIPVLVLGTGLVTAFLAKQYGDWKRDRGQRAASQGLY